MKKSFIIIFTLFFAMISASCIKKQEISQVYIVDEYSLIILGTKEERVRCPTGPCSYKVRYLTTNKVEAPEVKPITDIGILRPGLDLRTYDSRWAGNSLINRVGFAAHNTIYVEKNGKLSKVKVLYVCTVGGTTRYNTLSKTLDIKELSPIEVHNLPKKTRRKIKRGGFFVIDNN